MNQLLILKPAELFSETFFKSNYFSVSIHASLFHVSSDTGELIVKKVGETPKLRKTMLITGDCFILDAANEGNIFVWKGKEASVDERRGAMATAEEFIVDNNYRRVEPCKLVIIS